MKHGKKYYEIPKATALAPKEATRNSYRFIFIDKLPNFVLRSFWTSMKVIIIINK